MKKKRKIIIHRLLIVIFAATAVFSLVAYGTYKIIDSCLTTDVVAEELNMMVEDDEEQLSSPVPTTTNKQEIPEETMKGENKEYLGEFLLTGYCPCEICSEGWDRLTATGTIAEQGRTIAVDPRVIPYGSIVEIDGHRYTAEDCGGMINENHIDIFMNNHEDCYQEMCNGFHDVYLIIE